jgi:hypothetical protein
MQKDIGTSLSFDDFLEATDRTAQPEAIVSDLLLIQATMRFSTMACCGLCCGLSAMNS